MKNYFIPRADVAFNNWQAILIAYVATNKARFNVTEESWAKLMLLKSVWDAKFAITDKPETRTAPAVIEKKEARNDYEDELRVFIKGFLQYNPSVTDGDRTSMGLPIHSTTRTPVPTPTTYPEFEMDSSVIRRLTVRFRDSGKNSYAKPHGVHGAEIRWAILPEAPAGVDALTHSAFDTHTPFTLEFTEAERGETVYFCLRWENTRSEKGPWGEIGSAIIP